MINDRMAVEVKGLLMDAVGQVTGNELEKVYWMIENNQARELDHVVAKIEDQFVKWASKESTNENCKGLDRAQVNMYIRNFLYEKYKSNKASKNPGAIQEWRPNTLRARQAMEKVDEILDCYDRRSTDWVEQAYKKVKEIDDPMASAIFAWAIVG